MGAACSAYGGEERRYRVLAGNRREELLGRHRRSWKDNIKIDLQGVGCESMGRIDLAHDRDRWRALVNAVMNLRVPQNSGNFLTRRTG